MRPSVRWILAHNSVLEQTSAAGPVSLRLGCLHSQIFLSPVSIPFLTLPVLRG